jgi:hypothetical protein
MFNSTASVPDAITAPHLARRGPPAGAADDEHHDRESDELQPADCL